MEKKVNRDIMITIIHITEKVDMYIFYFFKELQYVTNKEQ